MKQKTFFIVFEEVSFGETKIWEKTADTSFKSELMNFHSPWNYKKTYDFLMI